MQLFQAPQNDNDLIATINKYDLAMGIKDFATANILEKLIIDYTNKQ